MKKKLRIYANTQHTTGKNQSKKKNTTPSGIMNDAVVVIQTATCVYIDILSLCLSIARMSIKSKTLRRHHHHHPPLLDNSSNDLCVVCFFASMTIHSSYRNEETRDDNVGRNGYTATFVALCERGDPKKGKEKRVRRFGDRQPPPPGNRCG